MGTAIFLFNNCLDVVSGLSAYGFDFKPYNEGLDEDDKLHENDYERLGDILSLHTDDFITDLKFRAYKPDSGSSSTRKSHHVDRYRIHSDMRSVEDDGKCATRQFGGIKLAEIRADTLFFGEIIPLEMAVILRSDYMTVKHHTDDRRYYDHGLMKK